MVDTKRCPICEANATASPDTSNLFATFYTCPVCGRYSLEDRDLRIFDENHLRHYLFYNAFKRPDFETELRYYTTLSKEKCDEYVKELEKGNRMHGRPVHIDSEMVEAWYPKSFAERIDRVLEFLGVRAKHVGQQVVLSEYEMIGLLFIDDKEKDSFSGAIKMRDSDEWKNEITYFLDYLQENSLVKYNYGHSSDKALFVTISPKGYARIDELQKAPSAGRNVLVAMKFGPETTKLREAIREGINSSGFYAVFIDEVQHNDFITPELLKHIRDSRFVVVDLTHQNPGAYFEEGYAMGLGKQVIQLCSKETKLHFDIAQKNTIMWESEDEIPLRLKNRIIATID